MNKMAENTMLDVPVSVATAAGIMKENTSLVIAVCVLGTLVGVTVVTLLVFIVVYCCGCPLIDRKWVEHRRRRPQSRIDLELERLAAGSANFISDSMLPGNRTGASENLGIKSPDPRKVPALRMPADLSPSIPYNLIQIKRAQQANSATQNKPRDRFPSPRPEQLLGGLSTITPKEPPSDLQNTNQDQKSFTDSMQRDHKSKGVYSRIPSTPKQKSCERCKTRQQTPFHNLKTKNNNGYPDSNPSSEDETNQCKEYGHSYYKPGSYSSYFPQNVFRSKNRKSYRSPRSKARNLYARIPVDDDNSLDSLEKYAEHAKQIKNAYSHDPTSSNEKQIENRSRTIHRQLIPSQNQLRVNSSHAGMFSRDSSPPLASSSRNTSADRSGSQTSRQKDKECDARLKITRSNNETVERITVNLPSRSRRVAARSGQMSEPPKQVTSVEPKRTIQSEQVNMVARIPHRSHANDPCQTRIFEQIRGPVKKSMDSKNFEPGIRQGTRQQTGDCLITITECDAFENGNTNNFRSNCSSSSNYQVPNVHQNHQKITQSDLTEKANPSQALGKALAVQGISEQSDAGFRCEAEPSILYNQSHHSSNQSMRPSHLFEGSSSLTNSQTFHFAAMQTPVAHSSQVVQDMTTHIANMPRTFTTFQDVRKHAVQTATATSFEYSSDLNSEHLMSQVVRPTSFCHPPDTNFKRKSDDSNGDSDGIVVRTAVVASREDTCNNSTALKSITRRSETPSFMMNSRDIVDPTTASMSWDHLTPDPSPICVGEHYVTNSCYTPDHIKRARTNLLLGQQRKCSLPESKTFVDLTNFEDSFAQRYSLQPYKNYKVLNDARVSVNLNPAVSWDEIMSLQKTDAEVTCLEPNVNDIRQIVSVSHTNNSNFTDTRGRTDIKPKPANIMSRFVEAVQNSRNPLPCTSCDRNLGQSEDENDSSNTGPCTSKSQSPRSCQEENSSESLSNKIESDRSISPRVEFAVGDLNGK